MHVLLFLQHSSEDLCGLFTTFSRQKHNNITTSILKY